MECLHVIGHLSQVGDYVPGQLNEQMQISELQAVLLSNVISFTHKMPTMSPGKDSNSFNPVYMQAACSLFGKENTRSAQRIKGCFSIHNIFIVLCTEGIYGGFTISPGKELE